MYEKSIKDIKAHKTKYVASIFDGYSHINRRVYEDQNGTEFVKINGILWDLWELPESWDVRRWYNGTEGVI